MHSEISSCCRSNTKTPTPKRSDEERDGSGSPVDIEPIEAEGWSLKRLAWAYGCAKKGSEEEQRLLDALLLRVLRSADEAAREAGQR